MHYKTINSITRLTFYKGIMRVQYLYNIMNGMDNNIKKLDKSEVFF